jgi:hypothetical protein
LVKLFADDTNLFIYGPNLSTIENEANNCFWKNGVRLWFVANK